MRKCNRAIPVWSSYLTMNILVAVGIFVWQYYFTHEITSPKIAKLKWRCQNLPAGITLPIAAVTGYCIVSARATEINPTVLSRTIAVHTISAAFHAWIAWKWCLIVVLSLLRPPPPRAVAERWVDVIEDTHIFVSPPVVAQWCHTAVAVFNTRT